MRVFEFMVQLSCQSISPLEILNQPLCGLSKNALVSIEIIEICIKKKMNQFLGVFMFMVKKCC